MNILWFTENYPPNKGGMARSCDRIISGLRKYHTIDIYHFTNKSKPFITEANVNGSYTAIPIYLDSSHTLNVLWAFLKNKKEVSNAAIFVSFGSHLCLKGIPLIAKWLQKPVLTCFRGNDFDTAIFSSKKQDLLFAIQNSTAIACVTKEKVERVQHMHLNENVHYTPNSILLPEWEVLNSDRKLVEVYQKELVAAPKIIIGLIGYLKQKKGIDFFIDCLMKSPLINHVHLRIVGEIEPIVLQKLQALGISHSIVSPNSKTELIANYLLCNAIAIPSIYDGMPNVVLEAGALKIPVIASNAGGLNDILNKENSFLFDVLSEDGLISQLTYFYTAKPEELNKKRNLLFAEITSTYTINKEIDKYQTILKNIC